MHPTKEYHETFVDINPVSTAFFRGLYRWIQAHRLMSPSCMMCINVVSIDHSEASLEYVELSIFAYIE